MTLAELLTQEVPDFDHIQEARVGDAGWECAFLSRKGVPLGGAIAADRELCRKIGLAETLERHFVSRLSGAARSDFLCDEFPTTCGFALGLDRNGARERSACEALERWAWSKWIDENYFIERVEVDHLTPLSSTLASSFEEIQFFLKRLLLADQPYYLGVTLGLSEGGVFAGSRVARSPAEIWTHALSESIRHKKIFAQRKHRVPRDIIESRIQHFGANAAAALSQVARASKMDWPQPTLRLQKLIALPNELFLYRTLCNDYRGWHDGTIERFVY